MQYSQPAVFWDTLALIPSLVLLIHGVIEGLVLAIALPRRMGWPRVRTWVVVGASYLVWAPCFVLVEALASAYWSLGRAMIDYGSSVGPVAWSLMCCAAVRGIAGATARELGLKFSAWAWWRVYPLALLVASCVSLPTLRYLLDFLDTLADKSP